MKQKFICLGANINVCFAFTIAILEGAAESSLLSHEAVFSVDDLNFLLFKVFLINFKTAECGLQLQCQAWQLVVRLRVYLVPGN